jgi:hypothetical protein
MDLVLRTFKVCDEALQQANLVARDLDGVILVGGPTRLPLIRNAVRDYFQQEPRVDVDPDEVVAMGAAIHAASLVSDAASTDAFLLDVTPLSLRIGVAGGLAETVIERNTPVPIEQMRVFTTYKDFQESVKIRVYQGESRQAEENEMLGQFEFSGFRKARRGEVRIEVTFEINSDGIVNVTARDPETGQKASTAITLSSGLSEQEIQKIIDAGKTERVVHDAGESAVPPVAAPRKEPSPAPAARPAPPPAAARDPLPLPAAGDDDADVATLDTLGEDDLLEALEGATDLELDAPGETALENLPEDEADPNADTHPELAAAGAGPAAQADVDLGSAGLDALDAGPPASDVHAVGPDPARGLDVGDLDGEPGDAMEIQTGAESLFDLDGADFSRSGGEDSEER